MLIYLDGCVCCTAITALGASKCIRWRTNKENTAVFSSLVANQVRVQQLYPIDSIKNIETIGNKLLVVSVLVSLSVFIGKFWPNYKNREAGQSGSLQVEVMHNRKEIASRWKCASTESVTELSECWIPEFLHLNEMHSIACGCIAGGAKILSKYRQGDVEPRRIKGGAECKKSCRMWRAVEEQGDEGGRGGEER